MNEQRHLPVAPLQRPTLSVAWADLKPPKTAPTMAARQVQTELELLNRNTWPTNRRRKGLTSSAVSGPPSSCRGKV